MSLITINIALIPQERILDLCVKLTKNSRVPLGKKDFLPHMTLFMGCVEEKHVSQIKDVIKNKEPVRISVDELRESERHPGEFNFSVEKTSELQKLHEEIMREVEPFRVPQAKDAAIVGDKLSETSEGWLNDYVKTSAKEKYWAHISLRTKEKIIELPKNVKTRLGIFQVGDGCTCRREL